MWKNYCSVISIKLWGTLQQISPRTLFQKQKKFHLVACDTLAEEPSCFITVIFWPWGTFGSSHYFLPSLAKDISKNWIAMHVDNTIQPLFCVIFISVTPIHASLNLLWFKTVKCPSLLLYRNARQRLGTHRFKSTLSHGFSACFQASPSLPLN